MENNQEHKIDKIFRETFENQEITPPSDAWTGIHTYTIGQKEKKPKIWLRYVSLVTLLLLISGFGIWYFVDNQVVADVNTPVSLSQEVVSGDTRSNRKTQIAALENVGKTLNLASVKTSNQLARLSIDSFNSEINHRIQDLNSHDALIKTTTIENKPLIIVDSLSNHSNELAEPLSYSTDNKLEFIEPKPLIFDNLSGEIQKKNENMIVALEENMVDKKAVFKADSVDYGKRFSLRHPMLSINYGHTWNEWTSKVNSNSTIPNSNVYQSCGEYLKIGIAWNLSKKSRIELNVGINNSGNISFGNQVSYWSNSKGYTKIMILKQVGSDYYYEAGTPFGNVNIPVYLLDESGFNINPSNPIPDVSINFQEPHSFNYIQSEINFENDLVHIRKMNKSILQLYFNTGVTMQREIKYNYNANYSGLAYDVSNLKFPPKVWPPNVKYSDGHLQNATDIVWGVRFGIGLSCNLAKKWNLSMEGGSQTNINSWVKNQPYLTKQSLYSLQSGIQLNF